MITEPYKEKEKQPLPGENYPVPALLMCPPRFYDVSYVINPWMRGNLGKASLPLATQQWQKLYRVLCGMAHVLLVEPVAGSPDMVFTANAGLAHAGTVVISSFYYPERQNEETHFRRWFADAGYRVADLPREISFEGEGDALFSSDRLRLWVGYGYRTSESSHAILRELWGCEQWDVEVAGLHLVDPRFYHLDTCFAPLKDGSLLYYPPAFDQASIARIESYYSPAQRIVVSEQDAMSFACNAVNIGKTIVLNRISAELERRLMTRGFEVIQVELSEFLKAGGAAKCLVMQLTPELHLLPKFVTTTESPHETMHLTSQSSAANDLIALEEKYGAHNYHPLDVVIESAQGAWVTDVEGRRYLDFLAAYSAVNQGHCHPAILRALTEQAGKVALTSRAFRNTQLPLLLRDLHDLTGFDMALPMNSGAEAVETALKAARKWGEKVKGVAKDRAEIIVCANNFHGRTISIVGFSTEPQYRDGFGPFAAGFRNVPYGDVEALRNAITPNTCAFLVEPIQGEAGIILPPAGYLGEVAKLCRENNVLLILDEIQSGLGRTGKLFAYMHDQIRPDVLIIGKALSGGFYPVSAVLSSREVLGVFRPGDHGSTFGGNPLACAVARAALRVIVDEDLSTRSAELGAHALAKLRQIRSPHVVEVRGIGLWLAIELNVPARPFCEQIRDRGVLCKETHEKVIRIAPPLTISPGDLDWGLEQIARVIEQI
ncbi:ornithine--oxo-acid transaminase [Terriglobus albidus]|uniref:ornithine--oxo-acid transaminase n=1 Tax=Terriglobus albidus TaxID=1592106 RepID=UPI00295B71DB|nr:ornithine--oxo-acid transaminase [Terriglobus albidus]